MHRRPPCSRKEELSFPPYSCRLALQTKSLAACTLRLPPQNRIKDSGNPLSAATATIILKVSQGRTRGLRARHRRPIDYPDGRTAPLTTAVVANTLVRAPLQARLACAILLLTKSTKKLDWRVQNLDFITCIQRCWYQQMCPASHPRWFAFSLEPTNYQPNGLAKNAHDEITRAMQTCVPNGIWKKMAGAGLT